MSEQQLSIVPRLPDNVSNVGVIEVLKDLMAEAEAGNLVGIAAAGYFKDRSTVTEMSAGSNATLLLGAVAYLMHRLSSVIDRSNLE